MGDYGQTGGRKVRGEDPNGRARKTNTVTAIMIAVIIGLGAAFWFYKQLPEPLIQLTVEPQPSGIVVSWPPDETNDASRAYIRINNGPLLELPAQAKSSGRYQVEGSGDNLEFEVIAQHTLRDSRGMVRYIQPTLGR